MGRQKSVLVAVAALALAALVSAQPETEIAAKSPSGAEFMVGKIKLAPALAPALAAKLGGHAGRKLEQAKPAAKKAPSPAPPSLAQGGKAPAPAPSGAKKPASKPPASKKPAAKPAGAKPAATQPTVPTAQGGERRLLAAHLPTRALRQDEPQAALAEKTKGEAAAAPAKAHSKKKTAPAAGEEEEEKEGDRRRRALLQGGQMLAEAPAAMMTSEGSRRRLAQAMETGVGGAAAPFPAIGAPAAAPLTHAAPAPAGPEFATFKPAASPAAAPLAQQQGVAAGAPAAAPGAEVSNSVYDAIAANPQYSVLKSLVDKAGLAGALGPQFAGTAFVPSNAAFDTYAKSSGTSVQAIEGKNPADIKKLVAFHVIKSKIDPATVKSKETQETLLTGAKIDLLPPAAGGGATEAAATALPLPTAVPSSMPSSKPVPLAPVVYRAGNALIVPTDGVLTPSAKDLQASI